LKVLVTGAGGFIGRNVSEYLEGRGYEVLRSDLRDSQVNGDLTDSDFIFKSLRHMDFEAVIHLAAIVNIRQSLEDIYRCFKVNCFGTLNILELSAAKEVKRFVYASSANFYGLPLELPVKETTPPNPRTPYDYSKVVGELLVKSYGLHRGLPFVILRSWKLFGMYDAPTAAIPRFIEACLRGEDIPLFNEGRDVTDPVYIEDYCRVVELCLERGEAVGEVFNIGGGSPISVREIAEAVKELTSSRSELKLLPPRTPAESEPMKSYPSIDKLRERLRYTPHIGFREGLRRTIEWYTERLQVDRPH